MNQSLSPLKKENTFQSPLKKVSGLGSAHNGTTHWWAQRVTAIFLCPLGLWFLGFILPHTGPSHSALVEVLQGMIPCVLMTALLITTSYHAQLGLQVVIEDYVHSPFLKQICITGVKSLAILLTLAGFFSLLIIQFRYVQAVAF